MKSAVVGTAWAPNSVTNRASRGTAAQNGLDPAEYATFEAWASATQAYQAMLLKHHVETLRRLKYRPTGGFCQFAFADSHPAVTWSVLDHQREPKLGFDALAAACAPVIVVADRPAAEYRPGDALALDVHVVSDVREPIEGARLEARLVWNGGSHERSFAGDIPADSCVRVTTLQVVVPDAPGPLTLDLTLEGSGVKAANRYEATITPA